MRLILFFLGGFMLANLVVAGSSMIRPQAHEQQRMFRDANKRARALDGERTLHRAHAQECAALRARRARHAACGGLLVDRPRADRRCARLLLRLARAAAQVCRSLGRGRRPLRREGLGHHRRRPRRAADAGDVQPRLFLARRFRRAGARTDRRDGERGIRARDGLRRRLSGCPQKLSPHGPAATRTSTPVHSVRGQMASGRCPA